MSKTKKRVTVPANNGIVHMQYEIRKADMENYKEYTIWKHANEDIWEVRPEDWHVGSDVLILVDEKEVMEFDYNGEHFRIFKRPNNYNFFGKTEEFKDMGVQKVVYIRFSDEDFVDVEIK